MKVKKLIVFILIAIIILPTLAGCKPNNEEDKDAGNSGECGAYSGVYAIYDVDIEKLTQEQKDDIDTFIQGAKSALEDFFCNGYAEVKVTITDKSIRVEIPRVKDAENIFTFSCRFPIVEFKERVDGKDKDLSFDDPNGKVKLSSKMTGADIKYAEALDNPEDSEAGLGDYRLEITFTKDGLEKMSAVSSALYGERISIWINETLVLAPYISSTVTEEAVSVSGFYNYRDAKEVALKLRMSAFSHALKLTEYNALPTTQGVEGN